VNIFTTIVNRGWECKGFLRKLVNETMVVETKARWPFYLLTINAVKPQYAALVVIISPTHIDLLEKTGSWPI